jgi:protein ImuB
MSARLAYVFFSRFPMQRRILSQPSLAGKPVILVHDERGTQRVAFASGAALKYGIKPGMTASAAGALSAVEKLRFDENDERLALASLGEALIPFAPSFEIDDSCGLWLEASAAHLFQSETRWAERLLDALRQLGFKGHCAVGSEKATVRAVARAANTTEVLILPKHGGPTFGKLPLHSLGVDVSDFRHLGFNTLAELAAIPVDSVVSRFGQLGRLLHQLSSGHDDALLVKHVIPESIVDALNFDWPVEQLSQVLFGLKTLLDRTCARLKGRRLDAVKLTLHLGDSKETTSPQGLEVLLSLSRPTSNAKMLVDLFRHRLEEVQLKEPISSLFLTVNETSAAHEQQLNLGHEPSGDASLEVVLSRLQSSLGEACLFSAQLNPAHRPEANWTMEKFSPPEKGEKRAAVERAIETSRPPRLLSNPARLYAETMPNGNVRAVTVSGRRCRVESMWGPERLQGSWWSPESFSRDYYRVQVEGVGLLWVFQDGKDGQMYAHGVFD